MTLVWIKARFADMAALFSRGYGSKSWFKRVSFTYFGIMKWLVDHT